MSITTESEPAAAPADLLVGLGAPPGARLITTKLTGAGKEVISNVAR